MVICLERGADLHMAQLMPLPLATSCVSKIQIGFTFLVPAHLGSPEKGPLNGCVCVYCMKCFFTDNAVRAAFLCKHVRMSRVFYNKLTYYLPRGACVNVPLSVVVWCVVGRSR